MSSIYNRTSLSLQHNHILIFAVTHPIKHLKQNRKCEQIYTQQPKSKPKSIKFYFKIKSRFARKYCFIIKMTEHI